MKQIINNSILIGLILCSTDIIAQPIKVFIDKALQNNYQINIVKNEAQIASNNNTAANAGQLPTLGVNGTLSNSYNNTKQLFSDGSVREGSNAQNTNVNLSALANWTVFNGFSVYAKKNQLSYLQNLGELNTKYYIEQTVSDIIAAYHQLAYQKEMLKQYEQSMEISKFRLKLEEKRKQVGAGKAIDYGQALVDFQTDSIRLLAQQDVILSLEVALNKICNLDLESPVNVIDTNFELAIMQDKEALFALVKSSNSSLEQQRLQELIAETNFRLAQAQKHPKIDVFAGYQFSKTYAEVGFIESNQNFGPTVGLNVSFNLYNGGNSQREQKNAGIYVDNAKLTKEQVQNDLDAELLNLYRSYHSITNRIALAKSNVDAMTKVYETAAEQLKKGAINGYDFRLTQLSLVNAELTLMQLQYNSKIIEIQVQRLTGKVLDVYL